MEVHMETIATLVTSLILSGGLGYINYYILQSIGCIQISKSNKEEKSFVLILFSLINIIIFFIIKLILTCFIRNLILLMIASLTIAILLTLILSFTYFKWVIDFLNKQINKFRRNIDLGEISNKSVRSLLFDKNMPVFAYAFDLKDNTYLVHGCLGWSNESPESDFEFEIVPVHNLEKITFEEGIQMSKENTDASIYVNVSKNIKIILLPEQKNITSSQV